jgi:hydroxyquinol 1,2-dioxygenase
MQALVSRLHQFACKVKLTEDEWRGLIAALTATGQITNDRRQEFILWSDTLGLSMLVDALANPLPAGATGSTVLGPFYAPGAPLREYGESMVVSADGVADVPAWVHGRVRDADASRSQRQSSTSGRTDRTGSTRCSAPRHPRSTFAAAT